MNEQTTKLIEKLAEKFGTTAEHLWSVLLKQAMVHGIVTTIAIVGVVIVMALFYRFAYKLKDVSDGVSIYLWWAGAALVAMVLAVNIGDIVSCFFNPEYWALKQVLDR